MQKSPVNPDSGDVNGSARARNKSAPAETGTLSLPAVIAIFISTRRQMYSNKNIGFRNSHYSEYKPWLIYVEALKEALNII